MKLIDITTKKALIEFDQNNRPIFHDDSLGRELFDFGILIPPQSRTSEFQNKTVVFPPKEDENVATVLSLFKKAFIEIYYPPHLMQLYHLQWQN